MSQSPQLDIERPRWDQRTFRGRLYHYALLTDPRKAFVSSRRLYDTRRFLKAYKRGEVTVDVTPAQLFKMQSLCESAFHPDTGQLQNVFGRMTFFSIGGTALCAAMMIWYRSTAAVVFWQWTNQSFNALVNYTNRNAKSETSTRQLATAYASATTAAVVTAVGLKTVLSSRAGSLAQRLVPFVAVAAANCVNIPLMRQNELREGVMLQDEANNDLCESKLAAAKAIALVTVSRIVIATPCMLLTPIVMERLEMARWFVRRRALLNVPIQTLLTAILIVSFVPIGCALFPQRNTISLSALEHWEPKCWERVKSTNQEEFYFNKGL